MLFSIFFLEHASQIGFRIPGVTAPRTYQRQRSQNPASGNERLSKPGVQGRSPGPLSPHFSGEMGTPRRAGGALGALRPKGGFGATHPKGPYWCLRPHLRTPLDTGPRRDHQQISARSEESTMEYRMEHDTMGQVAVPADKLWGAQTQRSLENFPIGDGEDAPRPHPGLRHSEGGLRRRPTTNWASWMTERFALIQGACRGHPGRGAGGELPPGRLADRQRHPDQHELQRGHRPIGQPPGGGEAAPPQRPREPVPVAPTTPSPPPCTSQRLLRLHRTGSSPPWRRCWSAFKRLENANGDVVKTGRTHLQDAVPITFGQEISGWRSMLEHSRDMVTASLDGPLRAGPGGHRRGHGAQRPSGV